MSLVLVGGTAMTLATTSMFPLVVEGNGGSAVEPLRARREELRAALHERGALLRGFDVEGADGFTDIVRTLSGEPLPYTERCCTPPGPRRRWDYSRPSPASPRCSPVWSPVPGPTASTGGAY
ncbi:hypothetical protein OG897_37635 [Streptomyces sp. NBC_00237]|uniref:hypothetical protein n=1 Tax=Streptomyces sp. NBC_00237 TaxID=2975687 RepID=UPI00225697B6|nr:hypothetical protein [Streptomyces sp. NBC_00237]MCX5207115.1 hypothetical protein [Streptomyces sp. NBC_00237]